METKFTLDDMRHAFNTGILAEAVDADFDEIFAQLILERYGIIIAHELRAAGFAMKSKKCPVCNGFGKVADDRGELWSCWECDGNPNVQ